MRTTVTLEKDIEVLLKRAMKLKGISFKEALNAAVRAGLTQAKKSSGPVHLPVFEMQQRADLNLDKALQLAGELEDEELTRRLAVGK